MSAPETIFDRELRPIVEREVMSSYFNLAASLARGQADIERMHKETICWACNKVYPAGDGACPACGKINANVDLDGAVRQMECAA